MASNKNPEHASLFCFLAYTIKDTHVAQDVRNSLEAIGVDIQTPDDLSPGTEISAAIASAILRADFVCIVLSGDVTNPALWFEAGLATGSSRPLLVVADENAIDHMPFNLFSAPLVRYRRDSRAVLDEGLRAYVSNVQPIAAQLKVNWNRLIDAPEPVSEEILEPRISPRERDIQAQLVQHFMEIGLFTASYARISPDKRVDALIGFPLLGDEFGQVLIEIKRRRTDEQQDISNMLDYMDTAGVRLSILAYVESYGQKAVTRTFGSVGVLLVAVAELLSWDLQRTTKELTLLRNRIVHSS